MGIFSWIFKDKEAGILLKHKHLPQIASLKNSIKAEVKEFHAMWKAHEEKAALLRQKAPGRHAILEAISRLRNTILILLTQEDFFESLLKKIMVESVENLHEMEAWVWREKRAYPASFDPIGKEMLSPQGRRTPYGIEAKKRAVWELVKDEKRVEGFVKDAQAYLQPEFFKLKSQLRELSQQLLQLSLQVKRGNLSVLYVWSPREDKLLIGMRKTLSRITNKLLLLAQEESSIVIDEQKVQEDADRDIFAAQKKKIGVMLIHGITSHPQEMDALAQYLRAKLGCITYVVRLPGHGRTLEEFALTPIAEIETFLIQAFKYFYQYMKSKNGGDGRFYVIGLSIGAMMPLHILAKSWGSIKKNEGAAGYPYQAMVKGMVSMAACIFFGFLGSLPGLIEKPISLIGPRIMQLADMFSDKGISYNGDKINDAILDIRDRLMEDKKLERRDVAAAFKQLKLFLDSGAIDRVRFEAEVKNAITPMVMDAMEFEKKRQLSPGDQYILSIDDARNREVEENVVNKIVELIIRNAESEKRPISTSAIRDIRALLIRKNLEGHAYQAMGHLNDLFLQLREDVKNIRIPMCVIQGMRDTVAHPKSGDYLFKNIKTPQSLKMIFYFKNTGHVPTRDFDKKKVFMRTADFIEYAERFYQKLDREELEQQQKEQSMAAPNIREKIAA
ncbi:hypothetical protein HYU13_04215 [Candidatus Woesearchaeota archaeon]|nr:hypothetical protein [Candidatus Woesearchaeota archaeon]